MGFYGTSFGQKMKKIGLLPFSSFKLVVSGSPKRTSCTFNQEHAPKRVLKPSTERNRITLQIVGWLWARQPLTAKVMVMWSPYDLVFPHKRARFQD